MPTPRAPAVSVLAAPADDTHWTITQLAREFDVTPRAIRFYEDRGLINPARQGQNRIFSRRDRGRLQLILRGKRLGFSLGEIGEMLDLYDEGDGQVEQMRVTLKKSRGRLAALERQAVDVTQAIAELREGVKMLEKTLRDRGESNV
ncbi:MAG: MerR family DNA-binding transcriptional regulator [Alphaproteobacteria bacterium]|nr:MerR family DNA-binding transcriptional regulator [Alphaproteobacteria bacterium]